LVIDKSAAGPTESVSVALLSLGFGSITPAGTVTVAAFAKLPVALGTTVPVTVKVTPPPAGKVTGVLMLPLSDAAPQAPPEEPAQVQLTPLRAAGIVSTTVAPVAVLGPALETTIV
jgi:hypothetical protein